MKVISKNNGLTAESVGLLSTVGYELTASTTKAELSEECRAFVSFICDYLAAGALIRSGETVSYGYWLTKAILDDSRQMRFFEYNPEATEFVFGVSQTLTYWREQHELCASVGATFTPPSPDQMIVVSDGVCEGDDIEAVRYPSPNHMSGWWFTTDRFNGDIKTLRTVHAHHVSASRPDLAKYFALPSGYRFFSKNKDVWFDERAAQRS